MDTLAAIRTVRLELWFRSETGRVARAIEWGIPYVVIMAIHS